LWDLVNELKYENKSDKGHMGKLFKKLNTLSTEKAVLNEKFESHTIKYGTRIKTIPKHVQLVPEKSRSIFVGNKIAEKNNAIDGEIRRLPPLIENTGEAGILLHIFGNFMILKLKSSRLS
jgi:hypothetical protein